MLTAPALLITAAALSGGLLWAVPRVERPWQRALIDVLLLAAVLLNNIALGPLLVDLLELQGRDVLWPIATSFGCAATVPFALVPAWRGQVAGGWLLLTAFVTLADAVHGRTFGSIIPLMSLRFSGQALHLGDDILSNLRALDWWLAPSATVGGLLIWKWPRGSQGVRQAWWAWLVHAALVGVLVHQSALARWDLETWLKQLRSWQVLNGEDAIRRCGMFGAHVRDGALTLRESRMDKALTPKLKRRVKQHFRQRAAIAAEQTAGFGALRGQNVIVVQIEAMQSWVIGAKVDGRPVTPWLNQLPGKGLYFNNLFDQTGSGGTSDCEFLVFNSQHSSARGSAAFRFANNDFVALPALLREAGYATVAAHAFRPGMWNRGTVFPRYGFDETWFQKHIGKKPTYGWGMADHAFYGKVLPRLENQNQPFFAYLITLTSHSPYHYLPDKEQKLKLGDLHGTMVGNYLQSMAYVDRTLRNFVQSVRKSPLGERTTIVMFGDHDGRLHMTRDEIKLANRSLGIPTATLRHIARRDPHTDRIPLFILPPPGAAVEPARVGTIGGQIDIGPTILHLLGVARPQSFLGRALWPERPGRVVHQGGTAVTDGVMYLPFGKTTCLQYPGLRRIEKDKCQGMLRWSQLDLEMSRAAVRYNLAEALR